MEMLRLSASVFKQWRLATVCVACLFGLTILPAATEISNSAAKYTNNNGKILPDSILHAAIVDAGPIDIHCRYLSMQGPYLFEKLTVGEIIDRRKTVVPASKIRYLKAAAMDVAGSKPPQDLVSQPNSSEQHTVRGSSRCRQLYWYRGMKVEMLDEQNKIMPTNEFLCHVSLRTSAQAHSLLFPYGTGVKYSRDKVAMVSQGQKAVMLPPGFGIPFASDEKVLLGLRAVNRSTDKLRRITIRCTLYFQNDRELKEPMHALAPSLTWIRVIMKRGRPCPAQASCAECVEPSEGEDAPNDRRGRYVYTASNGNTYSAHWVVPPGLHAYRTMISGDMDPGFALNGPVRAAIIHVHPYCTSFSLIEYRKKHKKVLFTAHCKTTTSPGVEITQLDTVSTPRGIFLHKDARYFQEVVYNNTSGKPVDSMAASLTFFSDVGFKKPDWAR